jgi:hypothetical protein
MTMTRVLDITEGRPVVDQAYSNRKVRVTSVEIKYAFDVERARWYVRGHHHVKVSGAVLRKDGKDSKLTHDRWPEPAPGTFRSPEYVAHPDWAWLAPLIDLMRPTIGGMSVFDGYDTAGD